MKFEKIQFKNTSSQKIYENYISQIKSAVKPLSEEDQQDILMELNSHIYEGIKKNILDNETGECNLLLNVLEKIGMPSEILKPLIAEKKLKQATKTFNPIHVLHALILNISFGTIYFIFLILYTLELGFIFLIFAKIFSPNNVGFFYKKYKIFQYGLTFNKNITQYEVLGYWFIPVTVIIAIIFYLLITLLLKLKKTLKK